MEVRKILGGVSVGGAPVKYGIGKLQNGKYAVGHLLPGQTVPTNRMFETLDAAFDHWYATLPSYSPLFAGLEPAGAFGSNALSGSH